MFAIPTTLAFLGAHLSLAAIVGAGGVAVVGGLLTDVKTVWAFVTSRLGIVIAALIAILVVWGSWTIDTASLKAQQAEQSAKWALTQALLQKQSDDLAAQKKVLQDQNVSLGNDLAKAKITADVESANAQQAEDALAAEKESEAKLQSDLATLGTFKDGADALSDVEIAARDQIRRKHGAKS